MSRPMIFTAAVAVAAGLPLFAVAQSGVISPTESHKQMMREAGEWTADVKMWMAPDSEPVASKGTETIEKSGDYWLLSTFTGDVGGQKFVGKSVMGYDPTTKKYVGTWFDTMTPYLTKMEGEYDVATHTLTMMAEGRDPATGETTKSKMVTMYLDDDTKTFEMYGPVPGQDGEWWKMMEVNYKRTHP